nr:MAG TPA: Portal protein [Caudoviricetes sp.]
MSDNSKKYMPTEKERKLVEWVYSKFKQAYVAKAPLMDKWKEYMSAYKGTYFQNKNLPDYKSNEISNHVFSTIETIRPIMTDNNPKFLAVPSTPQGMEFSADVQTALDYEWDREKMSLKLPAQLIPMLVYGNAVWFVQWDGKDGEYGNISIKPVDPFNIFPDPLAESIDNSEFLVYATYRNANQIKQQFPEKASAIEGSRITMSELVAERDNNDTQDANQVLILEMWCRDWVTMDETVEGKKQLKYPKGRVITCLPELGILLSDKKNPYKDGKFPFVLMKNYDIPFEFWGVGEIEQIMSPQHYVNELTNQIIDNAKNTANMQWIIDKNSGIGQGKLTNRPGLVIRKTPGSEVRRDTPPAMPSYVREQIEVLKKDIQDISGVFDSLKGEQQGSVTAASAILALQEASQARIRLKIKLMEASLSELAQIVYSRMQQFWKLDRWVRVTDVEGNPSFREIGAQVLSNDYDLKVMAGSTMPVNRNAMLDLMIRLAQTNGEDGLPLVDRKAVLEFLPTGDKKAITDRFAELQAQQQQAQQQQLQQEQQMQMQQAQQQKGELDQSVTEQVMSMLQQVVQASDLTSKQVDELIMDKEQRDKKEYESQIEEKGYKRGLKDGKVQSKEEATPNEETSDVNEEEKKMLEEQLLSENAQMEEALNSQQIPDEVLEELLALAQQDPEMFSEILQNYPQLAEMLQQDMQNMNGGMINEDM